MRFLARLAFRLAGWKYSGYAPQAKKLVIIGAPHTSNWDFILFLAATSHFGIKARVLGKHTLVQGPFGWLMRRLGVIPVERGSRHGVVGQMVAEFARADDLALVIAPEGTRGAAGYWRSGFYKIATAAGVPLVVAMVDAANKTVHLHQEIALTGNVTTDMDSIRALLEGANGIKTGGGSEVRLREEDSA